MNYQSKSKEELIAELEVLKQVNSFLMASLHQDTFTPPIMEDAIHISEYIYRTLFDNMMNGFAYCKMSYIEGKPDDFTYLFVNPAFENQTGLKNVIGKRVSEVIPGIKEEDDELFNIYSRVALIGIPEKFDYYLEALDMWFSISVYSPEKEYFVAIFDVITERKKGEEAIKRQAELLNLAHDSIIIRDLDSKITYWNSGAVERYGWTSSEVIGKVIHTLLNTIFPIPIAEIENELFQKDYWEGELTHTTKNGSIIIVASRWQLQKDVSNQPIAIFEINNDITQQKKAEDQIQKLSKAVEQSPVSIIITDLDGNIEYANSTASITAGYSLNELLGKNPRVLKSGETSLEEYQILWDTITHGNPWKGIFHNKRKNGELYWESSVITPLIDKNGQIINYLAIKEDITERKRTEELLRLSEEKYRTIVDNIGEGVGFMNPEEQFIFVNRAAEKLFGVESGKLEGTYLNKFITPDQYLQIQNETIKRSQGENSVYELEILPYSGENRTILVTAVPQIDQKRGFLGTYGVFRDITERKEAEAEIKLINEKLEKLIVEKNRFFSLLAHDMRSPFNGFLGLTEILATEIHQMSMDEIQSISQLLNKSASNLYDLLGNLLEWSRLQRDLIMVVPESFTLLPRISESLKFIKEAAKKKEIRFDFDIPVDLMIYTDPNVLDSIIRNLTNNAVKFTPKGGRVIIGAKLSSDRSIDISIKDTGIGMNNQMIDNLFSIEVDTSRKGTDGESSTGMGLIICRDLIEKLGGELNIESVEGKGSEFRFILPFIGQTE